MSGCVSRGWFFSAASSRPVLVEREDGRVPTVDRCGGWRDPAGPAVAGSLYWRRASLERSAGLGGLAARHTHVPGRSMHAQVSVDTVPDDRLPVILVHGLGMSSRYMIPIARHLAPLLRVYAPDLPGFGLSEKPRRAFTVRELADALAAWMHAVGVKRAAFVGNSLGCEVLLELALVHPQLVDRLVLQGPRPIRKHVASSGKLWASSPSHRSSAGRSPG